MSESVKANNVSDLWSQAYQELDDKAQQWIGDASKNVSGEERTQDLITLVRNREEEYKDGTLKIRIGDSEIMWRDYANSVVSWITAIGDISISFAPAGASVAWSALKVLLKVNLYTLIIFYFQLLNPRSGKCVPVRGPCRHFRMR